MNVPGWWALLLLTAACYRSWRLLAEDDVLDRPRRALTRLGGDWKDEGDAVPPGYRFALAAFLTCPWCLGFWLSLAWWAAWQAWPHATLVAAAPLAISAAVGLAAQLDRTK